MESHEDKQFKMRRDLLAVSILLFYVNVAKVDFTEFSLFGAKASISERWAYGILLLVWIYFAWRYFVKNWHGFTHWFDLKRNYIEQRAKDEVRNSVIKMNDGLTVVAKWGEIELTYKDDGGILCKTSITQAGSHDNVDDGSGGFGLQPAVAGVAISAETITQWEQEFSQKSLIKHELALDVWIPVLVVLAVLISCIWRIIDATMTYYAQ